MSTENSLAHTKWECKYHIVFAPKYRRQVIYKQIRADVGQILGTLCKRKGIEIIEAEACPDHIHMLVRIPPKYSVSEIMGACEPKIQIWKEGHVASDSRLAVKPAKSERKSVLGALQEKKEQVRTADGGRQEQQKAQNRPHTRNDISI